MHAVRYTPEYFDAWNVFLEGTRNYNFLFNRQFLKYHEHRFTDHSLLILNDKKEIQALLPANVTDEGILWSHQGLTFGGFLFGEGIKLNTFLSVYSTALAYYYGQGIPELCIKCSPDFYDRAYTTELDYALFLSDAVLFRRDMALVIDQQRRIPYTGNIRREGVKAEKGGAMVRCDDSLQIFWDDLLVPNLRDRFGIVPTHSAEEICLLKSWFPDSIRQYNVYMDGKIMAGATMFLVSEVAHCQYIAASDEGRKNGALNHLFKTLIDTELMTHRYFDFGTVNEDNGRYINHGMLFWKEGFGGRAHKQDFYRVSTESYNKLTEIIKQ